MLLILWSQRKIILIFGATTQCLKLDYFVFPEKLNSPQPLQDYAIIFSYQRENYFKGQIEKTLPFLGVELLEEGSK